MRTRLLLTFLVAALGLGAPRARATDQWVWFMYPYAYFIGEGGWTYINEGDTQWCVSLTSGSWTRLGQNDLFAGWTWLTYPYAYWLTGGQWFYFNESDEQWLVRLANSQWQRLGASGVVPDMVRVPTGGNIGTNALGPGALEVYSPAYPPSYTLNVPVALDMDRYEISKAQWDEVYAWATSRTGSLRYQFSTNGQGRAGDHPVHSVNWYDCAKWCNARSEKESRVPAYYTSAALTTVYRTGQIDVATNWVKWSAGYRLPKESEWEYAARGGVPSRRFPWGSNTISHAQANYYADDWSDYDQSSSGYHPTYVATEEPFTSPIGSFGANGYGLHDMAGNLAEWCSDAGDFPASRVVRGGSWTQLAFECRTGARGTAVSLSGYSFMGFRTVRAP